MPLPTGQGPPSPALVGRALLDRVIAYYEQHADPNDPDAPVELPGRRFVAGGEPRVIAWDLDAGQVHVAFERTTRTGPNPDNPPSALRHPTAGTARNRGGLIRSAVYEVQVVRTAPAAGGILTLPTAEQLDAHGQALALDHLHLLRAVTEAITGRHLVREVVEDARVDLGDTESVGPSGRTAAVAIRLVVPLL